MPALEQAALQRLIEQAKALSGFQQIRILPYGPESTEMTPKELTVFVPPESPPSALLHELGHGIVYKKFPALSRVSDVSWSLYSISPLLALIYLIAMIRSGRFQESPFLHSLAALAIWKAPMFPRFFEEYLASAYGQRLAQQALQQNIPVVRENLPYLMTYIY